MKIGPRCPDRLQLALIEDEEPQIIVPKIEAIAIDMVVEVEDEDWLRSC